MRYNEDELKVFTEACVAEILERAYNAGTPANREIITQSITKIAALFKEKRNKRPTMCDGPPSRVPGSIDPRIKEVKTRA